MKILFSWLLVLILVLAPSFALYALHNGAQDDINQSIVPAKDTPVQNNTVAAPTADTNDLAQVKSKLAEIDTIKTDLKKLSDNFSTQFITQFNNLASIGIAAAITSISIFIARWKKQSVILKTQLLTPRLRV